MALVPVVTFIGGVIIGKIRNNKSNGKIKKILSLTKSDSILIIPLHEGTDTIKRATYSGKCITYEEALILNEINKTICSIFKNKYSVFFKGLVNTTTPLEQSNNHIYFGGFRAHDSVHTMMGRYCSNVKFSMDSKSYENQHKYKDMYYPCVHKDDDYHIKIGTYVFSYNAKKEGYVILIKLTNKIIQDKGRGTVHICFGPHAPETAAAAKSFNDNRVELYNRLKHRKTCYFAIMKCQKNGEIDFKSFRDCTGDVWPMYR